MESSSSGNTVLGAGNANHLEGNGSSEMEMQSLVNRVLFRLSDGLVEREVEVKLLLLAALCREHILLLGPPGTGIKQE
jgi:MoxR-like ATPase